MFLYNGFSNFKAIEFLLWWCLEQGLEMSMNGFILWLLLCCCCCDEVFVVVVNEEFEPDNEDADADKNGGGDEGIPLFVVVSVVPVDVFTCNILSLIHI